MQHQPEHRPQGAFRQADGSVLWRIWAPLEASVTLVTWPAGQPKRMEMTSCAHGYFEHRDPRADEGLRYAYQLIDGREYPDPASRWQPDGVHRPSAVFSPDGYAWADQAWGGVPREDLVIYELHVGTFTPEGTIEAIIPRLPQLATLGVTALEIMPVAQFPGDRGWGYDGVHPYAVQNTYGGPRALQRLVDAAHQQGLGIILDVVYNHVGPEGNYLGKFGPYFTDRYHTPWGSAINYDGPGCDGVRQFVIDNACAWVRDFHVDGLRLDAVQTIYDFSARHILADVAAAVHCLAASEGRLVHVIAESNQNDVRLISSPEEGGYALDGVWSDDFHHSVHALFSGDRDGYYLDFGSPEQLAKAFNDVFVFDGCYSRFRDRRYGSRVGARDRTRFVVCLQNHDQVGNHGKGDRLASILPPAAQRLACGLLMLSPGVPLLFMGEEYGEEHPFPFFCSFIDPALIEAVRRGRREEMGAMRLEWAAATPDPQGVETFQAAKLAWSWPEGSPQARMRRLYEDLLAARRRWPAVGDRQHTTAWVIGEETTPVLIVERGGQGGILAVANLAPESAPFPAVDLAGHQLLFDTEDARYGGGRTEPIGEEKGACILPYELLIFGARAS